MGACCGREVRSSSSIQNGTASLRGALLAADCPVSFGRALVEAEWGESARGDWNPEWPCPAVLLRPTSLLDQLAAALWRWGGGEGVPVALQAVGLPSLEAYVDVPARSRLVDGAEGPLRAWRADPTQQRAVAVVRALGPAGVLGALGLRRTAGSCDDKLPATVGVLHRAFLVTVHPDQPKVLLTVGGRALSKHAQRSRKGWWGSVEGNEQARNQAAVSALRRVLAGAVWCNLHSLPHDEFTLEVREAEGYGVRWTADGNEFRGFLEPPMEGGHEAKWRHD